MEVADDLLDLSATPFDDSGPARWRHPCFLKAVPRTESESIKSDVASPLTVSEGEWRKGWEFQLSSFRDADINMLYVAMTRARKTLSVPASIKKLFQDFDRLHYLIEIFKKDALGADGRKMPLSSDDSTMVIGKKNRLLKKGEVWNLYHDLVLPLRKELDVAEDCMILPSLFPECSEDDVFMEVKSEEAEQCGELKAAKSEGQNSNTVAHASYDDAADYFDV